MIQLQWRKRKDGTLIAVHKKDQYTIASVPLCLGSPKAASHKVPITGQRFTLAKNNLRIYDLDTMLHFEPAFGGSLTEVEEKENKERLKAAKQSIKDVADRVANKATLVYQKVLATLKNKDKYLTKEQFIFTMKVVFKLDRLPLIEGPGKPFFIKCAEEGLTPRLIPRDRLKKAGLDPEDLSEPYLDSLLVELFPIWRTKMVKDARKAEKKQREIAAQQTADKSPTVADPKASEQIAEVYKGKRPESRQSEGLTKLRQVVESGPKCPLKPKNAKFQTLREWAEKLRDWMQVRGYYATVEYLVYAAQNSFSSWERCDKAARRIKAIYDEEWRQHTANIEAGIKVALAKPKEEEATAKPKAVKEKKERVKVGKDAWGFRETSEAAKVNRIFLKKPKSRPRLSAADVKRLAGVERQIGSHLSVLVKRKLIVRLPDGRFRLRKPNKEKSGKTKRLKSKGSKGGG